MSSKNRGRVIYGVGLLLGLLVFGTCRAEPTSASTPMLKQQEKSMAPEEARMWMSIGERRFAVTLTDSPAARAFSAQLPLTLEMSELNGNEKYASLPKALPANASHAGVIREGDLMLYGTDTLVVFYLTFNSSYPYTRLGRVHDAADLARALGTSDTRVIFTKD